MKTCKEKVIEVLSRGGRWTNIDIANVFLSELDEPNQNNTIAKYLSFLMREGRVLSFRVPGKTYCEYELIQLKSKEDMLIDKITEAIKMCPDDHTDYKKAMLQIEQLKQRKLNAA